MTKSQELFEAFCASQNLQLESVPESRVAGERRPDYLIKAPSLTIVAEVKEFCPNREERDLIRRLQGGETIGATGTVGRKVRQAIADSAPQLKALAEGVHPTLLVLYDNTWNGYGGLADPASRYNILTGMYGFEAEFIVAPPGGPNQWLGRGVSGGRKMTPDHNTSIGAVASLYFSGDDRGGHLEVFHNVFAVPTLAPEALKAERIHHFTLPKIDEGFRMGWQKIDP